MDEEDIDMPLFGWKAKLNYQFPVTRTQMRVYNLSEILSMFMCSVRYVIVYIKLWWAGKKPVMDFLKPAKCDMQSGVPLGGIGGGSIGRGFRGEFSRFSMVPGDYEYPSTTVEAAQFIVNIQDASKKTVYQKVLSCQGKPSNKLTSWEWDFPGENADYTALYPRSWTVFNIPEQKVKLICRQISPVIPNNYKDSSIPGAVFVWTVHNNDDTPKNVSIVFTFQSGIGLKEDKSENVKVNAFDKSSERNSICGISIKQDVNGFPLTYGLATLKEADSISSILFDPCSDGNTLWSKLMQDGALNPFDKIVSDSKKIGAGLCNGAALITKGSSSLVFSLTWDNPVFKFPEGKLPSKRYYSKYFGDSGNAAPDMCLYCIDNYKYWENSIESWQDPILKNKLLPDWYKSALFNELYYISDGGTIWILADDENLPTTDPRKEFGKFSYLEGHEYRMVNTYDVHYYASFALILLWPKLQLSLQYDFKDAIEVEDNTRTWFLYSGDHGHRKVKNTVPHDLGDPYEDPYQLVNSYTAHDVSSWKDLNLKFVLQVYRDYVVTGDVDYAKDMYPNALIVMNRALTWGTDEDGMIKNSGFPDQTYDAWTMSGVSAYCGSLWVSALVAFIKLANVVGEPDAVVKFSPVLSKAKKTFEKELWNGDYYIFDNSRQSHSSSIMSDQLCGFWYLKCSKITDEVLPPAHIKSALKRIYGMNVCSYYNGEQGAVNGMRPNGKIDASAVQSEEVWTGVTYSLASLLIFEGFWEEGFNTAKGLYTTVYEKSGLGFATPEALIGTNCFRAISYMRPLSIWSMQLAIEDFTNKP